MSTCMLRNWSVKFAGRGKFGTHRSMDMHMDKRSLQHKDRGQSDNMVLGGEGGGGSLGFF